MNIKPTIEQVKDHFSKAIEIAGNLSGKPQIIDTETHGIYWDGYHYRQCKNEFEADIMLWSSYNGFSEILKVKPVLLKDVRKGSTVYLQPLGNNIRYSKNIVEATVTAIKRKYFSAVIGESKRERDFSLDSGIGQNGNYSGDYKAYTTKYEAESATFSNDVRNEIVRLLNKSDYNSLLRIRKILKENENNK